MKCLPLFGPHTRLGLLLTAATAGLDQASKLWMLFGFQIERLQPVEVAPFLDLVMVWNKGISYGLFTQNSELGRWTLLGLTFLAVLLLVAWLGRAATKIEAMGLGLIIGGAIGNGIDRFAYGAVADFFHFHIGTFSWYVFNLADAAIVAGAALLLYETLFGKSGTATPS